MDSPITALLRKEMDFEVAFVKAGGLLLAGPDPTGNGGVLPGFGDQREIELLVEAGFTPVEASFSRFFQLIRVSALVRDSLFVKSATTTSFAAHGFPSFP